MKQVITKQGRMKVLQARNGIRPLPVIKGIALGNGAEIGEHLIPLNEASSMLQNEVIRKECVSKQINDSCFRYRIVLEENELVNVKINEAALYDADGELLAINVFIGKRKTGGMELAIEFDDRF